MADVATETGGVAGELNSTGGDFSSALSTTTDDHGIADSPIKEGDDIIDQIVKSGQAENLKKNKARGKVTSSPIGEGDIAEDLASVTPVGPEDVFSKALKEMGVEEEAPEALPEEEELDPAIDPKGRAAQTIQKLRARSQEAEGKIKEAEARAWEYAQAHQQLRDQANQSFAQLREQNAALSAKLEAIERFGLSKQPNDPAAQVEKEWEGRIEGLIDKRVSPLAEENKQLREQIKQDQQTRQLDQLKARHSMEANKALAETVFKNVDSETAKGLAPTMRRLLFAVASDTNSTIPEAAASVRTLMMKYAVGYLRGQAKQAAPQREKSQAVPRRAPPGRPGSDGDAEPGFDLLRHNGLDLAAWYLKGKPPLKPLPKG